MDEERPLDSQFVTQLANRLQKWQPFDITDRATDLSQHEILIV